MARSISPGSRFGVRRWAFDVRCIPVAVKRLILRRSGHMTVDRQVTEKLLDLGLRSGKEVIPHLHVVEMDIPLDPVAITALGANGVMLKPQHLPSLLHQLELGIGIGGDQFPAYGPRGRREPVLPIFPLTPLAELHILTPDANGSRSRVN